MATRLPINPASEFGLVKVSQLAQHNNKALAAAIYAGDSGQALK